MGHQCTTRLVPSQVKLAYIHTYIHTYISMNQIRRLPHFLDNRPQMVVRSCLHVGRALPLRKIPGTHFSAKPRAVVRLEELIKLKMCIGLIGIRTQNLPACMYVYRSVTDVRVCYCLVDVRLCIAYSVGGGVQRNWALGLWVSLTCISHRS
jgi:hypothetical protein